MKVALSIALVWYAFSKVDLGAALRLIREISPIAVAGALGVLVTQQFLASIRLRILLKRMDTRVGFWAAADAVFIGVFFSQTFISFLGGDAMRIWRIAARHTSVSIAARAVLLDRVAGFVGLVGLILASLPFVFGIVSEQGMRMGIGAAVALGITATAAFFAMGRLPEALRRFRVIRLLIDVSTQMLAIVRTPMDVSSILGISLLIQALNPVAIYLIAIGLGIEARLIDFLFLVPPVLLLAMLPISFAGWGVREGAMVVALGLVGVSPEQSVALSVCFGLALIAIGLPGGILWFMQSRKQRESVNA